MPERNAEKLGMNRFTTHIVGVISIDGLQQDAPQASGAVSHARFSSRRSSNPWPDVTESVISADNEQLQFELESAYLEFMNQVT